MTIAVFDSGIGGLSVLQNAMKEMPFEHYIYFADEKHVPYGEKTTAEIITYTEDAVKFFIDKGADAIVLACNTATSAAAKILREKYSTPIIGMEPAVKLALDKDPNHRVIAAATPVTVSGKKMKTLLEKYDNHHLVDLLPLPSLVRFAEAGIFDGDEVESHLAEVLSPYDLQEYSAFVLGCTHFNLFKGTLRKMLPENVSIIDGNSGTVRQLMRKLNEANATSDGELSLEIYSSMEKVTDEKRLEKIDKILEKLSENYKIG